ncbi:proteasomal ubiquitin receptor ADRM1-like isoform X1 [Dinothrombium tinctorium]|uniref:Proteasomal ubiquitin receptor ADRM1 homolog n=1 Tax=Dinothrombium tinctorium TaxID=1965070 RepID=A0A3S3RW95_9ACAR|nr:proteasomal ubiquitin receptor ADRM1-like isoform X1 [Dinothrombium tinctorium]RWS06948.1 proteasomal ubiquitin receptor ADRM1-like isoform X1 [Dinothrombium tinctorium]RWS06950.1 proteasomal ubiquitin receptor ADRM1-like isoform X1 [Dinothrombium tinctorium]
MARPILFGGNVSGSSQSKYLVEFKAGKMEMKGNLVTPLKRKGLVFVNQSDDNLIHFCWKDRQTGKVEDDLIIFPEDAEFKRVPQCTTGRVYVLKFKSSSRRCFYWLQEPKEDKDEEYCKKVNEYLNNPPAPGSRNNNSGLAALSGLGGLPDLQDSELHNLLNNMNPQHLMQMLGGVGLGSQSNANSLAGILGNSSSNKSRGNSSTRTTPASSSAPSTAPASNVSTDANNRSKSSSTPQVPIQLSDLQSIISSLTGTQSQQAQGAAKEDIDLSSAITSEAMQSLLSNKDFMDRVKTFLPPASPDKQTPEPPVSEQLSSTVQSPQFKQALRTFSIALQSGQLGPLMQQFGLNQACVDAANAGDLEKFVKALEDTEKEKAKNKEKKEDEKKDDDMALD